MTGSSSIDHGIIAWHIAWHSLLIGHWSELHSTLHSKHIWQADFCSCNSLNKNSINCSPTSDWRQTLKRTSHRDIFKSFIAIRTDQMIIRVEDFYLSDYVNGPGSLIRNIESVCLHILLTNWMGDSNLAFLMVWCEIKCYIKL